MSEAFDGSFPDPRLKVLDAQLSRKAPICHFFQLFKGASFTPDVGAGGWELFFVNLFFPESEYPLATASMGVKMHIVLATLYDRVRTSIPGDIVFWEPAVLDICPFQLVDGLFRTQMTTTAARRPEDDIGCVS